MGQTHAHKNVITDGLIFALDGANPRTIDSYALDLVGGLTGSYENGIDRDSNKQIWEFDGVDDSIDFGHQELVNFERTDTFSVEVWFKIGASGIRYFLSQQRNGGSPQYTGWVIYKQSNNTIRFQFISNNSTSNKMNVDTTSTYNDGVWHHMVWTYDGSSNASGASCYIDGSSVTLSIVADTLSASTLTATEKFLIGARDSDTINEYAGEISSVKIYNKVLTSDEVKFNYDSTKKRYTSEVRDSLVLDMNSRYPLTIDEGNNIWSSRVGGLTGSMESDATYDGLDMDFDGVDDNINFGDVLDMGLDSYTISMWVYLNGNNTSNDWIISKARAAVADYRWALGLSGTNQLYPLIVGSGNTVVLPTGNTSLNLNTWYMVDMVIDRSADILLYINGESESYTGSGDISAFSAQDFQTNTPLRIGSYTNADDTTPTNASNTKIPIVKIYNRVLTADEVLQNYNNTKHRFN
jgi:hypothetical protein